MKMAIGIGMTAVLLAVAAGWLWTPDKDRALLEARYATAPTDFITVGGVRLHVRDTGPRDAAAVIMLHGLGASLHTWESLAAGLSTTGRVVRYDLPGAGLTGVDPTGDYADERGMEVLLALMDGLGLARASLLGHSMGGRLAWRFAAHHGDRIDKLVLIAPDGFASPGFAYGKPPEVPATMQLMKYVLPRPLLRMGLAPAYADSAALTDALVARYHDLLLVPGVRGAMIARMEQSVLQDPVPILATIEAPTLLVWGDADAMIPIANAADYVAALPSATLVTLPGVGHIPQEEAPAKVLAVVGDFLGMGRN